MTQVTLTPHDDAFVSTMVSEGRYVSAGQMVGEGLRMLEDREVSRDGRLETMRREIALGLAQSARGETVDGPAAAAAILAELRLMAEVEAPR